MLELDHKESWALKNFFFFKHWRIDAFELWCWRRLLRVPWTAKRSYQSILKEISPEYSLEKTDVEAETLILWLPDVKNWLIGKDPNAGKDWRWEEKGTAEDEMVGSPTLWTWVWVSSRSWWWIGKPGVLQSIVSQRVGYDWTTELNWYKLLPNLQGANYVKTQKGDNVFSLVILV